MNKLSKLDQDRALVSLQAFVSNIDYLEVIKLLQLRPLDTWKIWTDTSGNTLGFFDHDEVRTTKQVNPVRSDLYLRATPQIIASHSTYLQVGWNKDKSIVYFWLLGVDQQLRMLVCQDGNYSQNLSPILAGPKALLTFVQNKHHVVPTQLGNIDVLAPIKCTLEVWALPWPFVELPKPLNSIVKLLQHQTRPRTSIPPIPPISSTSSI